MRVLLLLAVAGCAHQAPAGSDVIAGQLMVGTEQPLEAEAVVSALALEGYRFEYVAAASASSHLVRVTRADGEALTVEATRELAAKLHGRPGVKFVELNSMRQPR